MRALCVRGRQRFARIARRDDRRGEQHEHRRAGAFGFAALRRWRPRASRSRTARTVQPSSITISVRPPCAALSGGRRQARPRKRQDQQRRRQRAKQHQPQRRAFAALLVRAQARAAGASAETASRCGGGGVARMMPEQRRQRHQRQQRPGAPNRNGPMRQANRSDTSAISMASAGAALWSVRCKQRRKAKLRAERADGAPMRLQAARHIPHARPRRARSASRAARPARETACARETENLLPPDRRPSPARRSRRRTPAAAIRSRQVSTGA